MGSYCAFCMRIDHDDRVLINPEVAMFPPLSPVTPGHALVVPVSHVVDFTMKPSLSGYVMAAAAQIAGEFGGDCNIITSVGSAATQTVFHLHVHIVPRAEGDGLALPWTGQP